MNTLRETHRAQIGPLLTILSVLLGSAGYCHAQSNASDSRPASSPASHVNADASSPPELTRPGAGRGATRVGTGIWLSQLDNIDSAAQAFRGSVDLVLTWKDPRLAHAGEGPRRYELAQVWHPRVVLVNELDSVRASLPEVAEADPDGTVFYRQHFVGSFSQPLDLRRFPFDDHVLQIRLVSLGYRPDEITFEPAEHLITRGIPNGAGVAADLAVPDWKIQFHEVKTEPYAAGFTFRFAGYQFSFHALRNYNYYIWKVIAPLILVVAMSWTVFWTEPTDMGTQIGVSTTSMLTLIAYRFIIDAQVPRVPYMTRLDVFIVVSTVIVFLALVEAIVTTVLARRDNLPLARRMDRCSRAAFPLVYAVAAYWSLSA